MNRVGELVARVVVCTENLIRRRLRFRQLKFPVL